jgi:hypothetical protein
MHRDELVALLKARGSVRLDSKDFQGSVNDCSEAIELMKRYIHIYVCICIVCVFIYICVYICVYIYIYMSVYICMYVYISSVDDCSEAIELM